MWGSRTLWSDLLQHQLVDELHLFVGAGILGGGTPAFEGYAAELQRLEVRPFEGSGSVLLRYQVNNVEALRTAEAATNHELTE